MIVARDLPEHIVTFVQSMLRAEFATVSSAGVPIDTAVSYFPGPGLKSIDLATGVTYPAKAERARRNPKVGLLIEGRIYNPVVSIAGIAAIRDSDIQANVHRYIAELGHYLPGNPPWTTARKAVWYWPRIFVEASPVRVLWWDNAAEMKNPPHRWDAPADTVHPKSDPAPPGEASRAAEWPLKPWQELARVGLARGLGGHLTVADSDGYPLPMRARAIMRTEEGFMMELPPGVAWPVMGKATLSFQGIETFVGVASTRDGLTAMRVERALPSLPLLTDAKQLWEPAADVRDKLMARLIHEMRRRDLPIPTVPDERPAPTENYKRRLPQIDLLRRLPVGKGFND